MIILKLLKKQKIIYNKKLAYQSSVWREIVKRPKPRYSDNLQCSRYSRYLVCSLNYSNISFVSGDRNWYITLGLYIIR